MVLLSKLKPGVRLYDRFLARTQVVAQVDEYPAFVFLYFKDEKTAGIKRHPFSLEDLESRFALVDDAGFVFRADSEVVRLVAEAVRIQYAYLFNKWFTTETSLIDLLPHQLAAVYGVPATEGQAGRLGMVDIPHLRFLLADDAGAGKTIMAGLLIREMLLRRLVRRVLVVPPAGLVGNWRRELESLFRLRFRVLKGADVTDDYNPFDDPRYELAIVSLDTLWREKMRQAYCEAEPYELVIFDEAHKLSARLNADLTYEATNRYQMAEVIAAQGRHLLLMTATPHMGKDEPYYFLWRLLEPELLSTRSAFLKWSKSRKRAYFLRRMKEQMVRFDGSPIYKGRQSLTVQYPLRQGKGQEQTLYDEVTHYCQVNFDRAKVNNRSAAGLAMSILQRRLASSTWALLKSLERRMEKLSLLIQQVERGLLQEDELAKGQAMLPQSSVRDTKTADEEEIIDGEEESQREDEALAGATAARTLTELRAERDEVQGLLLLARQVYQQREESKFERLWEVLADYPDEKLLIFTEFRDTLDFLIDRLQGKGLTGQIAQIHGGIPYQKRDEETHFFQHEARIMVATDAAGEGINLQFCRLLVNYDIPWNPARLEQRMGRVHRYKQAHEVILFNLVSENTREGRVLAILLNKLERIRQELGNDKVFDIIGQQLTGKSLSDLIFEAVVEGKEQRVTRVFKRLSKRNVLKVLQAQERNVESSEVRALLGALQQQQEDAERHRMMPAYIRRFFQLAAPLVGVGIKGDIEDIFALEPCPPSVMRALSSYPEEVQQKLTFEREYAKPDVRREPAAIYVTKGEPVFEAVMSLFLGSFEQEGKRGALFYDPSCSEPYRFYLARLLILRESKHQEPETVDEQLIGLRCDGSGQFVMTVPHLLLTLIPHDKGQAWPKLPLSAAAGTALSDFSAAEAHLIEMIGIPTLQSLKKKEEKRLPERISQLRSAVNLRQAELLQQRRLLKEAVAKKIPAAKSKLRRCEAELEAIDERSRQAEAELRLSAERLYLGTPTIYVQALVLPTHQALEEVQSEKVAMAEVIRREEAQGSSVEDVSNPQLKAGFDLKVTRADGEIRYVEVKGRQNEGAVEMTVNEYIQAGNHRDRYWLYVVYNCATVPTLYRIPDPFGRLIAQQTGAVRINTSQIKAACVRPSPRVAQSLTLGYRGNTPTESFKSI